jgi:cold shock protein
MTEKNVDKIKIDDNIINNGPGIFPGSIGASVSGTVKWFSPEKGFGFVTCSDGRDIFVYYTEIQTEGFKTLQKGQKVQLEIFSGERGPQASNVRPI